MRSIIFILNLFFTSFAFSVALLQTNVRSACRDRDSSSSTSLFINRRVAIQSFLATSACTAFTFIPWSPETSIAADIQQTNLQSYIYSDQWIGTSLDILHYQQAASIGAIDKASSIYSMGRWPDPILRRPASPTPLSIMRTNNNGEDNPITNIANALRRTARLNGAVGLAAQQCAIDVSMIFLDDPKLLSSSAKRNRLLKGDNINQGGMFLVNPRIIARSSELEMKVWNEECLVLPPTFRATVLRDLWVNVRYENLVGETNEINLKGELARALQHELDHDHGILILDHVGLNELENDDMRRIEEQGHEERQMLAYSRFVADSDSTIDDIDIDEKDNALTAMREWIVPTANAEPEHTSREGTSKHTEKVDDSNTSTTNNACDEACMQERQRIIQERRAMMKQSRTNRQRSEVLELSKQRATLYGTNFQGVNCPPNIPCI